MSFHLGRENVKHMPLAVLALFVLMILAIPAPAMAEDNGPSAGPEVRCGDFAGDQEAAQVYYDANNFPIQLDANGNGIACDSPEDGDFGGEPSAGANGPSAGREITCGSFSNDQAAAQTYFDANGNPANLDGNGDGQACADADDGDFSGGPSAGTELGPAGVDCASFNGDQAAAQAYFDANDQPDGLDGDGDGLACASPEDGNYTSEPSAATENDTESTSEGRSTTTPNDEIVSNLPVAGSGMGLPTPPGSDISLFLGLSLVFGASWLHGHRLLRR
jgi:hypothetical protein